MTDENDEQDNEMNFGLTVAERDVLQMKLGELADTMPPREVWHRIETQALAEGLLKKPGMPAQARWFAGVGMAAAVVLAVIILPNAGNQNAEFQSDAPAVANNEVFPTVPEYSAESSSGGYTAINALMVRSQNLERDLRSLPDQPRVRRASTTATISDLQDQIAAIDYQLNDPSLNMTAEQQVIFWRERVRLMDLLVQLRYAQSQRMAF